MRVSYMHADRSVELRARAWVREGVRVKVPVPWQSFDDNVGLE